MKAKKLDTFLLAVLEKVFADGEDRIFFYDSKGKRDYAREKFKSTAILGLAPMAKTLLKIKYLPITSEGKYPILITFKAPVLKTDLEDFSLTEQELAKPYINKQIRSSYVKTAIKEGQSIAKINTFLVAMNLQELSSEDYESFLREIELFRDGKSGTKV